MFKLMLVAVVSIVALVACGGDDPAATPGAAGPTGELTVAAASDLQFAFTEIGELFKEQTGWDVTFSFGSTGNLTTQIEEGAPFDVFAAANVAFVDRLIEGGHAIADSREFYALGRVVVASNTQSGTDVQTLEGLLDPAITHVAIANPEHAPYGLAAKEALISAGVWDELQPKLVLGENVRATLQLIETGNAEAGIVALSIADVDAITWVLIDDSLHNPLLQAMAAVSDRPYEEMAREFIALVMSDTGQDILSGYGFKTSPEQ